MSNATMSLARLELIGLSLPKLTWDVDPIIFRYPSWLHFLPGDGLRYYSVFYIGVFFLAYYLFDWQIRRGGGGEDDAGAFFVYGVVATIIGSRLGHLVLYQWNHFTAEPSLLWKFGRGGISSHGGMLGLLVALLVYTKQRGQPFLEGTDRFTYSGAAAAAIIRIGNWFNSEIVGRKTDQTWGVYFPRFDGVFEGPVYRYPTQLYEAALGVFVFFCLWTADRRFGAQRPRGLMTALFLAVYFTGRILVEFYKEPQSWALDGYALTEGQILSILPACLGWYGIHLSLQRRIPSRWHTVAS